MNLALFKKYIVLEICAVAGLAALAILGVKLFAATRLYTAEKSALQAVMDRKQQLDQRNPYPSPENVRREAENFKDILDNFNELNELLRARQIEPRSMQAADFMPLLENTLQRIRSQLADAKIGYPPNFTFGFERYVGGKLPAKGDIPRLVQQLKIIDALCLAMVKVGVVELASLSREEFEGAAAAKAGAPDPRAEEALYTSQHFKLEVVADETAVVDLLNLLARCPMFTVVTSVELAGSKTDLREGAAAPAPAAAGESGGEESGSRERQIIIGRELVDLKLELDVYQFAPSPDFKASAGKKR